MPSIITTLLGLLPVIGMNIALKILTQEALQRYLERVIVYALDKLTPLTTNTLDDEIAHEIKERLGR